MIKGENRLGCFAIKILSLNVKLPNKIGLNIYISTLATLNNNNRLINVSKVYKSLFGMENLL